MDAWSLNWTEWEDGGMSEVATLDSYEQNADPRLHTEMHSRCSRGESLSLLH